MCRIGDRILRNGKIDNCILRIDFRVKDFFIATFMVDETAIKIFLCGFLHRNRQGNEQTRTFEPTNESAGFWSAANSYNFIIRVK